jgi:hypothetical protein
VVDALQHPTSLGALELLEGLRHDLVAADGVMHVALLTGRDPLLPVPHVLVQHARELAAGQQTNEQALVLVEGPDHLRDAQPLKDRVTGQLAGKRPGRGPELDGQRDLLGMVESALRKACGGHSNSAVIVYSMKARLLCWTRPCQTLTNDASGDPSIRRRRTTAPKQR